MFFSKLDYNKDNKNYIFLEKDGEILKYLVTTLDYNINNSLESYLLNLSIKNFEIAPEEQVVKYGWPINLVKNVGKFKLKDGKNKTNNFLVPHPTYFSRLLCDKYKDENSFCISNFTSNELEQLANFFQEFKINQQNFEFNILKKLVLSFQVELVEKYDFDLNLLKDSFNNIEGLLGENDTYIVLSKLKWILNTSKNNLKNIKLLNIENKFLTAYDEYIKLQKVKTK